MDPELPPEDPPQKSVYIFGRDITQIPCFRNTFLYGISGGIASGFAGFMFTSKPIFGMHIGMASFTVTTICYWFHCRYNYSKTKFEYAKLRTAMKNQATFEGTAIGEAIEKSAKSV